MNAKASKKPMLDVLIITALKEEYDAVLDVHAGAAPGSEWLKRQDPLGFEIAFRTFHHTENRQPMEVGVVRATSMGGIAATSVSERFIAEYSPRCLAMCGVCAGRRGDVEIGDVIVADRLWTYDTGKTTREQAPDGTWKTRILHDTEPFLLRADWKEKAENFQLPAEAAAWINQRPRSAEAQANWILERLLAGEDPRTHPDQKNKAPNFASVLQRLWKKGLVKDQSIQLTPEGRKRMKGLRLLHFEGLPEPKPFKIHVGPIGSGNKVVEDPEIFDRLSESMRKVLGLEMEASAIGTVGHIHQDQIRYTIVMKAAMDHADGWKSDAVKSFAARASAECLIAFLRQHLPPIDRFGDILGSGRLERQSDPPPSALLRASYTYVPFYKPGRAEMMRELDEFCVEPAPCGVWLIYSDGGMGKTRLMIEAVEHYRRMGWVAGFLDKFASKERFGALVASELPVLVVVDYAESRRELGEMLDLLVKRQARGAPLRAVLLARNADIWWTHLQERDEGLSRLLGRRMVRQLRPLVSGEKERREVVEEAVGAFVKELGEDKRKGALPSLEDERFDRVLYLHAAALAWMSGLAFEADNVLEKVLEHEEHFWIKGAESPGDGAMEQLFVEKARRAVAGLTLWGGVEGVEGARALLRDVNGGEDERLMVFLRRLYPARELGERKRAGIGGLEPDLLGEEMVWRALRCFRAGGDVEGIFLDRVFERADERALSVGFQVMGRLSERHEEGRGWIRHILKGRLEGRALAALEASKELGKKTAHAPVGMELAKVLEEEGTVELAGRLEAAGVPEKTVSLREVAVWVTKNLLRLYPKGAVDVEARAERAGLLSNLGHRQGALGQRKEALESAREAVEIRRELAKENPDVYLPGLAGSLNNLGNRQGALGQREEALISAGEAVKIRRELAEKRPDAFLPGLAMSLNNLGNRQGALGQREEALASAQEAVEKYRELEEKNPDAFLPDLAMSLNNLGNSQGALGQKEEALASAQEAVKIRRELAKERPDAFLLDLAMSLNNLGVAQIGAGQHEQALTSAREAVKIRRELAKERPDAFLPDLAMSLNNLGAIQIGAGQHEQALVSFQEAVDILWPFFLKYPDAFAENIRGYLNNLRLRFQDLNRPPDPQTLERIAQVEAFFNTLPT